MNSTSRRVVFLTPQLPYPPHQGTAIRNFGLINGLVQHGHRVTLLSFVEPGQPPPEETPLAGLCSLLIALPAPAPRTRGQRLRDLILGHADMARRLWSPEFLGALRELLSSQTFDVIHFEGLEMATYLRPVWPLILERCPDTLLIYDAHNAEFALQQRIAQQDLRSLHRLPVAIYSAIQAGRLERFESLVCLTVDHVLACSRSDAHKLAQLRQPTPISVIPNAIDVGAYAEAGLEKAELPRPALVFTGKMDFRPNVDAVLWFATKILPRIRQAVPGAHFAIVGQKPHPRLDALRGDPAITLTGQVPDIQPYIGAADVYVAPLRMGSGTRLKLLEAMAMGRAVVSTRLGAEGLDAVNSRHLLLADTPADFAQAVITLLRDEDRRRRLGENAAALVRERYDWSAVIPRLEAVYAQESENGSGRTRSDLSLR